MTISCKAPIDAISEFLGKYFQLPVNQRLHVNADLLLIIFLSGSAIFGTTSQDVLPLRVVLFLIFAYWVAAISYYLGNESGCIMELEGQGGGV